jgi:DNA-3-methyladenine glycosylase
MESRRGVSSHNRHLTSGPGKLTKALGIDRKMNAKSLLLNEIWLEDIGVRVGSGRIESSPRIGIDYAGDDAALPWRFSLKENLWVSR